MSIIHKNEFWKLELYYPFSGNANDESVNSYTGAVTDATLATGKVNPTTNGAYDYNGISAFIDTTFDGNLASYSILCWAKIDGSPPADDTVIGCRGDANNRSMLRVRNDDKLYFYEVRSSNSINVDCGDFTAHFASWAHLAALSPQNGTANILINGSSANTSATANAVVALGTDNLYVGALNNEGTDQDYFNGVIDELRIYSRVLAVAEVKATMYRRLKKAHIGGFI